MSEGDKFDLTRGGEEDEENAPVLSLRRRGRPTRPPETRPQNGPHRHLTGRVQVPLTAPAEPAASASAPTLGWNEPPDAPGPSPQAEPRPKSKVRRPARTMHRAIALGTLLLIALVTTVAVISTAHQTSDARVQRTHAASARTDNAALLPAHPLTPAGQALAVDIAKLASAIELVPKAARPRREAHHRHATARGASHSAAAGSGSTTTGPAQPSRSAHTSSNEAATPASSTTSNSSSTYSSPPTVSEPRATQPASSTQTVAQPAGPIGPGSAGSNCNPQCK
jgi:hypothetical protein